MKDIEQHRENIKQMMAMRRRPTRLIRDEMFAPDTEEQKEEKINLFKQVAAVDKASRLAGYKVLTTNIMINSQVKRTQNFFARANNKEDKMNEELMEESIKRYQKDGVITLSNID